MSTSESQVKVYQGELLVATFNVPTNLGNDRYWNVFAIKNGQLIVNCKEDRKFIIFFKIFLLLLPIITLIL